MDKKILLFLSGLLVINLSFGQDRQKYTELVNEAWKLYENKAYLKSGQKYSEAFVAFGNRGMVNDRYNAACAWAMANEADSAFVQLFKIAEKGNYINYNHMVKDRDLHSIHGDKRWNEVLDIVKANKEKAEANIDKLLVAVLDTIYEEDQKYRMQIEEVEEKHGRKSEEMKVLWKTIHEKDSINLVKVKKILDEHGWLGSDIIGSRGSSALFLVIQHADLKTQEKYLPMMRDAVSRGAASPGSFALLEDRVALRQGKRQIYGSQVGRDMETGEYFVMPLEDPDNVDKRRGEVGLGKLQDYISNWGMTWNVEEYKKQLPGIEEKQKNGH